jgi:flagellar basal-body rod modification protein FlgD
MAITPTSAVGAAGTVNSRATIAENFDTFLMLLTTQLRNQNPLEPLDTNQFTQQLVQFAGVEQQIRTNENLGALLALSKTSQNASVLSFVGATVTAEGATTELKDGLAVWYLTSPRPAQATINILDRNGSTVYTGTATLDASTQAYLWDGRTSTGQLAPPGPYKIQVVAKDTAGQGVQVSTIFSGVVDLVDISGEQPVLQVGSTLITLDQVRSLRRPTI